MLGKEVVFWMYSTYINIYNETGTLCIVYVLHYNIPYFLKSVSLVYVTLSVPYSETHV